MAILFHTGCCLFAITHKPTNPGILTPDFLFILFFVMENKTGELLKHTTLFYYYVYLPLYFWCLQSCGAGIPKLHLTNLYFITD